MANFDLSMDKVDSRDLNPELVRLNFGVSQPEQTFSHQ